MTIYKSPSPASNIKEITPSDTENIEEIRGIIIASAGDIVFVNAKDNATQTILDGELAKGMVHPICPKRINATGTTAKIYMVY